MQDKKLNFLHGTEKYLRSKFDLQSLVDTYKHHMNHHKRRKFSDFQEKKILLKILIIDLKFILLKNFPLKRRNSRIFIFRKINTLLIQIILSFICIKFLKNCKSKSKKAKTFYL